MRIKSAGGELKIRFDPANPTPPAQVLFVKENKLFALAKLLPGSFKPSDDPGMVRVKYSSVQWLTNKEPRT